MKVFKGLIASMAIGSIILFTGCASECCGEGGKCCDTAKKCPADCKKECCMKKK